MRIKKSALTLALALAVVFGIMIGANAADTVKTITASLNYGITIKYNGNVQEMKDANGNRVYPISYEGTTYLPVRAVADMLGIEVNWDGPTQTVWLGVGYVPSATPQASNTSSNTSSQDISKAIPAGTVVTINGKTYTSTGELIGGESTVCIGPSGQRFEIWNKVMSGADVCPIPLGLIDESVNLGDGGQSLADAGLIDHYEEGSGGFNH